eukprot:TRINITY_DN711_c0_g1_i1.p1 TRINITY_DN711_c0_g1~~TRINITY_DN711_c0_g1_i1.p1  ORF type:complete len:330 (-),score=56.04 TRINITY_DN711_c0_g1_i1:426-1415(-)
MAQPRFIDSFEKINRIGEGTYGVVYRARDKVHGDLVALKRVRMEREKEGVPLTALREIKLLKMLRHPNVVELREIAIEANSDSLYLVFEYCEHDMAALLDAMPAPFSEAEVKCLFRQVLIAVKHLHDNYVIHRDLKMSNLLYTNRGMLKLCDFGLARPFGQQTRAYTPRVVTLWYRAPELLLGDPRYSPAIDMWSLGCIFAELLLHKPLLAGKSDPEQVDLICRLLGTPTERVWPGVSQLPHLASGQLKLPHYAHNTLRQRVPQLSAAGYDLLSKLLSYDPDKRPTVAEALAHDYFSEQPLPKDPAEMPSFSSAHDRPPKTGDKQHRAA